MEISISQSDKVKLAFKYCVHKLKFTRVFGSDKVGLRTKSGPIMGIQRKTMYGDQYYSFEGIPYAKPPVGDLRFKSPVPIEPWKKIRNCQKAGPKPLQKHIFMDIVEGSEDCLYLNVYSKDIKPPKPLPVMVWIFGGGFQLGEATRDVHSPDYFMMEDVVLVVINYRLGPLGFLSLKDPELKVPGNAGLKDQAMALKWVKENCEFFGGDSNNITLFGVSAGSAAAHFLMMSNSCKNLFHKAILMSGTALSPWALVRPEVRTTNWTQKLVQSMGHCGNFEDKEVLKFLSEAKGKDIIKYCGNLFGWEERSLREIYAFGPVIEPYTTEDSIITGNPKDIMRNCWSKNIPIMMGTTSFEGLLLFPEIQKRPKVITQLSGDCEQLVPVDLDLTSRDIVAEGDKLKRLHFGRDEPSTKTQFEYLDMCSYKYWWHPLYRTLRSRVKYATAPTYLYRFDFDSKHCNHCRILLCGKEMRGVCHADDLSYIFVNAISSKLKSSSREYTTMRRMISMLTSFALDGNPNNTEMNEINWEPVSDDDQNFGIQPLECLNISDDLRIMNFPHQRKLKIWDELYGEDELV